MRDNNIAPKNEYRSEPISADPNPSMVSPGLIDPAIINNIAFNINKNNPKVSMVTGRVKRNSIGFNTMLSTVITITAMSALQKSRTWNPGTREETRDSAIALRNQRASHITMDILYYAMLPFGTDSCGFPMPRKKRGLVW